MIKRRLLLLATLGLLGVVCYSSAKDDPGLAQKKNTLLSIEIVLPEKPVTTCTRIPLAIKIRNVSNKAIGLPWPKYINQFIKTESKAQDRTVLTVKHVGGALGHGKYPGGDIKPGNEITVNVWHIFPDAGYHSLRCVLETSRKNTPWKFWEGRVESKAISVEVKPRKDG